MTLERIALLRNVGQFDSVNAGAQLALKELSLVYAENGRGKTTLAAILRSLHTNDPVVIEERHRLGATNPPHVVLTVSGASHVYRQRAWSGHLPRIAAFDDSFVAANVCSGMAIETAHRQNLHELILGAQGVALSATLQRHVDRVEEHIKDLRTRSDTIPAAARGPLTVDAFCGLPADPKVNEKIKAAERSLAAARAADTIRQRPCSHHSHYRASTFWSLTPFCLATCPASKLRRPPRFGTTSEALARERRRGSVKAWTGSRGRLPARNTRHALSAPRISPVRLSSATTKPTSARSMPG